MIKNYIALTISICFTIVGIFILSKNGFDKVGVGSTLFFLTCSGIGLYSIYIQSKNRKLLNSYQTEIQIELGKKIPVSQVKFYTGTIILLIVALSCYLFKEKNFLMYLISIFLFFLVLVLLIGKQANILGTDYIRFEKNGITRGNKNGSYFIDWKNISPNSILGEFNSNPAIFIQAINYDRLLNSIEATNSSDKKKIQKKLEQAMVWNGCNVIILGESFGLNTTLLWKYIIERIVSNSDDNSIPQF
ncbi:MAG: hypothetical protein SFU98_10495 [Leptospiraceae bacterium]|nr:hypothetical protein [Leptospiraceae bacterium]